MTSAVSEGNTGYKQSVPVTPVTATIWRWASICPPPPGVRFCLRGNGNIPQTPGVSAAINYTFNNVELKRLAYGYKYPICPWFVLIYRHSCLGRLRSAQTRFNEGCYSFIAGSLLPSFNIFILFLFLSSSPSSFSYLSALYLSCPRFTLTFNL